MSTVALLRSPVAYTVTITGTSAALNHSATGTLTVTAPAADFTIAATALTPATVAAGTPSTSTITIAPAAGSGFSSAVGFTCSVAPVVTHIHLRLQSRFRGEWFGHLGADGKHNRCHHRSTRAAFTRPLLCHVVADCRAGIFGNRRHARKKKLWGFLLGCLLFSTLIILPACSSSGSGGGGGGHPGTPAGTYTVTVTGTSGSLA